METRIGDAFLISDGAARRIISESFVSGFQISGFAVGVLSTADIQENQIQEFHSQMTATSGTIAN